MGDTVDLLADLAQFNREEKQQRHAEWFKLNMAEIDRSGIPVATRDTAVLFREPGKPKVDFYPHTGRWRVVGVKETTKTKSGGALKFLAWYRAQKVSP